MRYVSWVHRKLHQPALDNGHAGPSARELPADERTDNAKDNSDHIQYKDNIS